MAADAQLTRYNLLCLQPPPWVGTARVYDEVSHLSLPSLEIPTEAWAEAVPDPARETTSWNHTLWLQLPRATPIFLSAIFHIVLGSSRGTGKATSSAACVKQKYRILQGNTLEKLIVVRCGKCPRESRKPSDKQIGSQEQRVGLHAPHLPSSFIIATNTVTKGA